MQSNSPQLIVRDEICGFPTSAELRLKKTESDITVLSAAGSSNKVLNHVNSQKVEPVQRSILILSTRVIETPDSIRILG
jgi:hypothetical protein